MSTVKIQGQFGASKLKGRANENTSAPQSDMRTHFTRSCKTCQQVKCDTTPPKAPLIPMVIPEAPMQFISLDIAFMPQDNHGYQFVLLIGDIFSKFIHAVAIKDQTAYSIVDACSPQKLDLCSRYALLSSYRSGFKCRRRNHGCSLQHIWHRET